MTVARKCMEMYGFCLERALLQRFGSEIAPQSDMRLAE
jgi:hypothetical protein